jgi:hypothetical protein
MFPALLWWVMELSKINSSHGPDGQYVRTASLEKSCRFTKDFGGNTLEVFNNHDAAFREESLS